MIEQSREPGTTPHQRHPRATRAKIQIVHRKLTHRRPIGGSPLSGQRIRAVHTHLQPSCVLYIVRRTWAPRGATAPARQVRCRPVAGTLQTRCNRTSYISSNLRLLQGLLGIFIPLLRCLVPLYRRLLCLTRCSRGRSSRPSLCPRCNNQGA